MTTTPKSKSAVPTTKRTRKAAKPRATTAERFWAKVDKTAGFFECWIWTGARYGDGYGKFQITDSNGKSRSVGAHIFALLDGKPLPSNRVIMHACNCPTCCNPLHISIGTQQRNLMDAASQGRIAGRSMTRAKIREALTLAINGMSSIGIAEALGVNPSAVRLTFRGSSNTKITGIPRNVAPGGKGKGRDKQIYRDALAFMDAAEAIVVDIADHPKFNADRAQQARVTS